MATTVQQLLLFQKSIIEELHDPTTSDLLLLARGLGLRRIVCTLMQIYDGPENLVLLVNATPEEEMSIGEELGIMGCRKPGLRVVGYELGRKDRQSLYKQGGLISVTSRILVVDMLQSDIPIELITGMIILHAESVTPLSLPAFVVRLFREKNQDGFVKAFSDAPEHIISGLYPLRNVVRELQVRRIHIFPRFHETVKQSLERRKADVVELYQPLTDSMLEIHSAIVQCMSATLAELKRSNTSLDLDDINVESAYFRSFDAVVRRQLDPVWHKVGPKTKQLVGDLATLRNLLNYLLTYDAIAFHSYLESIIAANSSEPGAPKRHHSPWLFTDAANIIFQVAKRRCYIVSKIGGEKSLQFNPEVINLVDDEDAWDALDDAEGIVSRRTAHNSDSRTTQRRPRWLPEGMQPELEELPKWSLLAEVLQEIEEDIIRLENQRSFHAPGMNTVLVMCSSQRTCEVLSEYLSTMDRKAPRGQQGRRMMERRLREYLWWKGKLGGAKGGSSGSGGGNIDSQSKSSVGPSSSRTIGGDDGVSEALRRKDAATKQRQINRRRVRGGAPGAGDLGRGTPGLVLGAEGMSEKEREKLGILSGEGEMRNEADAIADFIATQHAQMAFGAEDRVPPALAAGAKSGIINIDEELAAALQGGDATDDVNDSYGLLEPQRTVILRAYSDDSDDRVLAEVRPRFIVMYEPNQDFVRRIECYRSSNPGLAVRVYLMLYHLSCEEHKYLAGLRREKDAFERLIKERGSMLILVHEERRLEKADSLIRTISTRIAGGKDVTDQPSQVIVDMREFRSTLPSLLHANKLLVIPATLTVGDYILTPDICVERKSIPDLVTSFNNGRLYTQCELMSTHYKQPVLLIEFEEHKSFSLELAEDAKSASRKYMNKKKLPPSTSASGASTDPTSISATPIQAKLVLLTLAFPRLRILWSSSPHESAVLFAELKQQHPEPDPTRAVAVGAEDGAAADEAGSGAGMGVNAAAEELLRALPGVTAGNVAYIMRRVRSVRALCEMSLAEVQELIGVEPGKACYEFIHRGE